MRMARNILGVIPARGGSKEILNKNSLLLGNKTILEIAIESAKNSRMLTRLIVSTENPALAKTALSAGAELPFERPEELSTDTASTWGVMQHAVTWLSDIENWQTDILVMLQPTTPFRRAEHIDQTVTTLLNTNADSAITVCETDYPPHWMLEKTSDGRLRRLLKEGGPYTRRQDTPKFYQPNGSVYAVRSSILFKDAGLPGDNTQSVLMSYEDSINIDHWWQYELAKIFWEKQNK